MGKRETAKSSKKSTLAPEYQAENERMTACLLAQEILAFLPEKATLHSYDDMRIRWEQFPDWEAELLNAGFERIGFYGFEHKGYSRFAGYHHKVEGIDAFLGDLGLHGGRLGCELQATHLDGKVTTVASFKFVVPNELSATFIDREELVDASPKRLHEAIKKSLVQRPTLADVDKQDFVARLKVMEDRKLVDLHSRASRLLILSPESVPTGHSPRYEAMGYYRDFLTADSAVCSTKALAQELIADVERRNAYYEVSPEDAVYAAGELAAMCHFQFLGAPKPTKFLDKGVDAAVEHFSATEANCSHEGHCFQALPRGLLLAMLADRWDDVQQIANSITKADVERLIELRTEPEVHPAIIAAGIAATFRSRASKEFEKLNEAVKNRRSKRLALPWAAWQAVLADEPPAFDRALEAGIAYFIDNPLLELRNSPMLARLDISSSIVALAATRRGAMPQLPASIKNYLATRESIGLSSGTAKS